MTIETPKSSEIKRLTAPLKIKDSKAYDSYGKVVKCSETLSDVRLIVEPKRDILSDDEILQYAPLSKAASEIRLKKGFGDSQDILYINENIPWYIGLYYVILVCVSIPVVFAKQTILMVILLILFIIPLLYLYYIFKYYNYENIDAKKVKKVDSTSRTAQKIEVEKDSGIESLKKYEKEISNLNVIFNVKQEAVRQLIKKRFEPPQITYDKFIRSIDKCEELFTAQTDSALNIINFAAEDTPRVRQEIENKIGAMKTIISQIEDLTNELVINISADEKSSGDVKNLLDNMENLIDSVKEY